jgi:hypothetical protein
VAIETGAGPFKSLIESGILIVPEFQRPYVWTRKDWETLWQDILDRYEALKTKSDRDVDPHFLGSVVYGEGITRGPLRKTEYDIIDGQQRLITLSILLAALRDICIQDPREQEDITNNYLVHPPSGSQEAQLRLRPGRSEYEVYFKIVTKSPLSGAERGHRVSKAYQFFCSKLKRGFRSAHEEDVEDPESDTAEALSSDVVDDATVVAEDMITDSNQVETALPFDWNLLAYAVLLKLVFVTIAEVPAKDAYQIFATINATGLRLGQVDLLRNAFFLFFSDRERAVEVYEKYWVPMERSAGAKYFEKFFHTDLLRQGKDIPVRLVYETQMKELGKPGSRDPDHIMQVLGRLKDSCNIYVALRVAPPPLPISGVESGEADERRSVPLQHQESILWLREWGPDPAFPLILETATQWLKKKIDDGAFLDVLKLIESLLVRRYICEVPPNDLRSLFSRMMTALNRISSSDNFVEKIRELMLHPTYRWRSDDEVYEACLKRPFYRPKKERQVFLILKRIEEWLERRERVVITFGRNQGEFSVEHIMPQTGPNEQWRRDLEEWGDDPIQVYESRKHVIGNLTLTAYNPELSDKSFAEKRQLLEATTKLEISKLILNSDKWSSKQIDERSEWFAKQILRLWPRSKM